MSWLTDFVRPKIRSLVGMQDVPDNLWLKCPGCSQMLFHKELKSNRNVCHHCEHHMRLGAKDRLESLFDGGKYDLIPVPSVPTDPLKFKDSKRYTDRLKAARAKTHEDDAVLVATGKINNIPSVIGVFDFDFMGGSMGMAVGEAILTAATLAVKEKMPLIIIPSSGGARMQEGILSLMQMPRTTVAISMVKDAGIPYIVILSDPTTGGVSASFAMLGDIAISEPKAVIAFSGRRVIENTIREKLPEDFQTAEYLHAHGMIDLVSHRKDLKETLGKILKLIRLKKTS